MTITQEIQSPNTTESTVPSVQRPQTLDQTLDEIRTGRRLEKIVSCIENFLQSQIIRLDEGLHECKRLIENDKIVKQILSDCQREKQVWESEKENQIQRLELANKKLAQGWEDLENERRKWIDQRDHGVNPNG